MALPPVEATALCMAAARALETQQPKRLFDDPLAEALAGPQGFEVYEKMQSCLPGHSLHTPSTGISIRTRYYDDALLRAVNELEIDQIVLLGAGMDTRAFRLPCPNAIQLYEVDQPCVCEHKESVLRDLDVTPRCSRQMVAADLEFDWVTPLQKAGFDRTRPAAFIMEGVLPYLPEPAIPELFAALGEVASAGSWLGADMASVEYFDSEMAQPFLRMWQEMGCPLHSGVKDPVVFLANFGWQGSAVQIGDPDASFGRWGTAPRLFAPATPPYYFSISTRQSAPATE
ncbi:SAM-dependent methyltransferase [bacterium]|nr:SAM-dependent methyltransferase [bacterium]